MTISMAVPTSGGATSTGQETCASAASGAPTLTSPLGTNTNEAPPTIATAFANVLAGMQSNQTRSTLATTQAISVGETSPDDITTETTTSLTVPLTTSDESSETAAGSVMPSDAIMASIIATNLASLPPMAFASPTTPLTMATFTSSDPTAIGLVVDASPTALITTAGTDSGGTATLPGGAAVDLAYPMNLAAPSVADAGLANQSQGPGNTPVATTSQAPQLSQPEPEVRASLTMLQSAETSRTQTSRAETSLAQTSLAPTTAPPTTGTTAAPSLPAGPIVPQTSPAAPLPVPGKATSSDAHNSLPSAVSAAPQPDAVRGTKNNPERNTVDALLNSSSVDPAFANLGSGSVSPTSGKASRGALITKAVNAIPANAGLNHNSEIGAAAQTANLARPASTVTATFSTPVVSTPVATPPALDQILEAVEPLLHSGDGNYELKLELRPHDLGRVEITVHMRDGVLSMHMNAEHAEARQLLREHVEHLRGMLNTSGVETGALDVGEHSQQHHNANAQLQREAAAQQRDNQRPRATSQPINKFSPTPALDEQSSASPVSSTRGTSTRVDVHA